MISRTVCFTFSGSLNLEVLGYSRIDDDSTVTIALLVLNTRFQEAVSIFSADIPIGMTSWWRFTLEQEEKGKCCFSGEFVEQEWQQMAIDRD
jgi:hypothetical protein